MPAGWQRSNGELVSLLQFLLFISSLSIFCLVNLVKAEFETRIFFFFLVAFMSLLLELDGLRKSLFLKKKQEWDFRHRKFAEELCGGV